MPPKTPADSGKTNLDNTLAGKSGLDAMSDEQLQAFGGTRDSVDNEDFKDADFGNEVTESQSDEEDKGDEVVEEETKDEDKTDDEPKADEEKAEDEEDVKTEEVKDEEPEADEEKAAETEEEPTEDTEEVEDEEEKPAKKGDQRVPLDRFREVNKRMRDAEARVEALERQVAATKGEDVKDQEKPYDFDAAEAQYQDLVLDGKKAEATTLRREIRAAEKAEYTKASASISKQTNEASHDSRVLGVLAQDFEKDFPEMDKTSDVFNPDINEQVAAMYVGYLEQGKSAPEAFAAAVTNAAKLFGLTPASKREEPKPKTKEEKKKVVEKKAEKGKAKVDKAKKAPPVVAGKGKSSDSNSGVELKSIDEMTDEELSAIPKTKLARMRGDIL